MALTPSTSYTQDIDDVNSGVVEDTTPDYGEGGNPNRGDAANYLLWSKTDSGGNRVYDNPSQGNVLSNMSWNVNTPKSGWYERMLMRVQPYNSMTTYVPQVESNGIVSQWASIVYYQSTNKVYKCIQASTGNAPTDGAYWEVVTELGDIIANINVSVKIQNTYVRSTVDEKVKKLFVQMGDKCACDQDENKRAYQMNGLLISANSEVNSGNYDKMEKIIAYLESQLSQLV